MIPSRSELLARLRADQFDVLIIGGGIVGAGVARDATMRGLRVALIEQGDFASGTSSKTSKLIHGGLRYLEHGAFRLVAESLRERRILRTIAPELVRFLPLLLPLYAGDARTPWTVRLGLALYDLLAWRGRLPRSRLLTAPGALTLEPSLASEGLRAAGLYADCQMDDARLCLATILQAVGFGAVCCNYVRLRAFLSADGQIRGGVGEDVLTGETVEIRAQAVVNATGPWGDQLRALSDRSAASRLTPTKGIHLILPRLARHALCVQARSNRRVFFVLPWGDYSLVGTTETAVDGALDTLRADADEVGDLLEELARVLPGCRVRADDVIATFAGARPLLAFSGSAAAASREHRIEFDRRGLCSVLGGKYTTSRAMAQQTVDALVARHRWRVDRCLTDQVTLVEAAEPIVVEHWRDITRSLDPDLLVRLLTRYGAAAAPLLRLIAGAPSLLQPVCPHHDLIQAELAHAFAQELACTVTDALARRTRIAWSLCQGLDALSTVSDLAQRYGGLTEGAVRRQVADYRRFLALGLAFRSTHA